MIQILWPLLTYLLVARYCVNDFLEANEISVLIKWRTEIKALFAIR